MKSDRLFWYLLPIFIIVSGNFTPLRIGPILPIYLLFIVYVLLNFRYVARTILRSKLTQFCALILIPYHILISSYSVANYKLTGNEFANAIDPYFYSNITFLRYILGFMLIIILLNKFHRGFNYIYRSICTSYFIIFLSLVAQGFLYIIFKVEVGYIFFSDERIRFGGLIGEPQTLAAWLFSLFALIFAFRLKMGLPRSPVEIFLILSQLVALLMTQSTSWIAAFFIFLFIRAKWLLRTQLLVIAAFFMFYGEALNFDIFGKISVEVFGISERSVTVIAGYELFTSNVSTILMGYGLGLSPYLMASADIFSLYPSLSLSEVGRQNVMNSYLEILFEFGLFGSVLIFLSCYTASGLKNMPTFLAVLPLLVGIFGVGSGFVSGYFLIAFPLLIQIHSTLISSKNPPTSKSRDHLCRGADSHHGP